MAEALVEYDYNAQELDELTIKKGDRITNISIKPGGWWEGTLMNGKRGMFPDNFVRLIKTEDGTVTTQSGGGSRKCKALFPYQPEKEDELELKVGDVIEVLEEVEEGWWKGSLNNKTGVFPSNFVTEITEVKEAAQRKPKLSRDESAKSAKIMNSGSFIAAESQAAPTKSDTSPDLPSLPPKPAKEYCRVIYKYSAANLDELSLVPGDVITILSKEGQDPGWWKGELKGKVGVFPDNFVEMITLEEANNSELKTKVTNRLRGVPTSILSKSATTSSISDSLSSLSRKFSDSSKSSEEKIPPSVSKKPVLPPPPNKKPAPVSSTTKIIETSTQPESFSFLRGGKSVSSNSSTSSATIKQQSTMIVESVSSSTTSSSKTTVIEDSADGISWSRQSYSLHSDKGSNENSVTGVSLNSTEGSDLNLDVVGRSSKKLVHPTATRAKAPKRRPPSGLFKEEIRNGGEEEEEQDEEEGEESSLVNGDTESHAAESHVTETHDKLNPKAPWVEELKMNQAKKSLQQQAGKTRVMIGMSSSTSERAVSGMTERTVLTSSSSASGLADRTPPSPENKPTKVTLRQTPPSGQQRPQSMISTFRPVTSPPSSTPAESITVPLKQWNELLEKVSTMEMHFESEILSLSKTVKELTGMLDEERQRTLLLQQEIEKLTDLVTQV